MTDTATAPATAEERHQRFHTLREQSVATPSGFLALVNTQWVGEEQTIWGVPGTWAPRSAGESGLIVRATAADGIVVDGVAVDGEAVVRGKDDPQPSSIVFDDHTTGTVIRGEDGQYALRVWDARSEDVQRFGGISTFPYNPDWVVRGTFTPNPEGTTVGFSHLKDDGATRELPVPGDIAITVHGTEYRLAAFQDGKRLQLVFADATSGATTSASSARSSGGRPPPRRRSPRCPSTDGTTCPPSSAEGPSPSSGSSRRARRPTPRRSSTGRPRPSRPRRRPGPSACWSQRSPRGPSPLPRCGTPDCRGERTCTSGSSRSGSAHG
jgi:uncharacterized protein (DUF1684 family)